MRLINRTALRFIVVSNFIIFIGLVGWFGGDPMQGGIASGHYYLGYHHRYVEVSQVLFLGMSAYMSVTFLSMIIAAVAFVFSKEDKITIC